MKRIISIITIAISIMMFSVPVLAMSGTGTESDPYLISTASDIAKIHDDLNGHYKLTKDIDMSSGDFEPIGNENEGAFTGIIDGDGYTISNLNINLPDNKYVGFVGYLEGTVKNLNITDVEANGCRYVGGLVGYSEQNSLIENCQVSGNITGEFGILPVYIGGISGYNAAIINNCLGSENINAGVKSSDAYFYIGGISGYNSGNINSCISDGELFAGQRSFHYLGGIVGENDGGVISCMNFSNIWANDSFQAEVGGICGTNMSTIESCTNYGDVLVDDGTGFWPYVGGIVGHNYIGSVSKCFNASTIIVEKNDEDEYVGGIVGYNQDSVVTECENNGKVISKYNSKCGGIVGEQYKSSNSYECYIEDCINSGKIDGGYGGAIAGIGLGSTSGAYIAPYINACINYGAINSTDIETHFGFYQSYSYGVSLREYTGENLNFSPMNCCFDLPIQYQYCSNKQLDIQNFLEFDMENIWFIDANTNSGFPQLRNVPRHINLNERVILLKVGEMNKLEAFIDGVPESVTWSSEDESIATVSADGTVTAIATGDIMITATNDEGMKMNCLVHITKDVSSVSLNKNETRIMAGKTETLTYNINPADTNEIVVWSSSNENIATVNQNGVVKAKAKGTTIIYATSAQSNIRAECVVNVFAPITSITLSETSKSIMLGSSDVITATLSPTDHEGSITWSSSDESIVTVDQNGKITTHKLGTAYITATATSGVTAQCTVTVTQPSTSVTMNKPNITTYVNSTYQLSASMLPLDTTDTITWSSSSTTYATVSSTGLVTGKKVGTATITATTSSGLKATCKVTVKATQIEPTSITLSDTYITLAPEDAKALTTTLLPSNATETTLTWTTSNDDVATVDRNGVITAVGEGFATIKAKTSNGLSHECVVKVVSASGPSVIVDNVKSFPAGIAKTKVNIIRNPGISGYKFTINYDDALLTPVSVTANEEFGGTLTTNLDDEYRTEFNVVWYSNGDTDININGELFTIDFKVAETAELGDYSDISIEYGAKDICNTAGENIALYTESAKVTVEEPLPGDIYEDGDVNVYDLTLLARHMIGLADFTDRQMEAANVTDDELVDIKDVVKLAQYVVGWTGVELMSLMSLDAEVPETPTVTVGTASVNDANEADIPVYIKNNTGIAAYRFVLDYNADDIEIVSITPSDFINPENFGTNLGQENDEGLIVFCYQEGNAVTDSELFTVKVRYKNPTDTSISPISIISAENNFCNQAIENVAANYETGYALGDDYIITNKVVGDTNFSCELYFDDSYEEQSAKAIIAFYDGDGRMVQLMPKDITVKPGKVDLSIDYDKKAYATYKLMIWEGLGNLKPITEVK